MAEYKNIGSISVVTDTETGQEKIGDVEGGFDSIALVEHVKSYGVTGLLRTLAYMNYQVIETLHKVNAAKDKEISNNAGSGS